MAQRPGQHTPKSPAGMKKGHGGGLDQQLFSHLHQDTRSSSAADLNKNLKIVRSLKPVRNYMKPTSSSDARKGKLQVDTGKKKDIMSSMNSNSFSCSLAISGSHKAVRVLSRQPSLKPAKSSMKKSSTVSLCTKKNLNRATCSSTLKDSKFPAALVLDHGATEVEGASKMRVCPYTYCSLNGHIHQDMSPLKFFISTKRKSFNTQRIMELEVEYSNETMSQLQEPSDITFENDWDIDQTSEFSQDETNNVTMNFLEYVEIDSKETAQEDYEFEHNRDIKDACIEAIDMDWEEILNNTVAHKEEEEDEEEKEDEDEANSVKIFDLSFQSIIKKGPKISEEGIETIVSRANEHDDVVEDSIILPETKNESNKLEKELLEAIDGAVGTCDIMSSSRWNVTRKRTSKEELEQVKEFNPKPPNFLTLELDPDAETVDLRHQTVEERKNAEDWMIDYALRQAVAKLGGAARRRKVALLVEAFETVVPPHACEMPLGHGTSSFTSSGLIQACN